MSDWGTPSPDLTVVHEACKTMEAEGLDVHTITVILDNGEWRVTILATDYDLEPASLELSLDTHGGGAFEVKDIVRVRA